MWKVDYKRRKENRNRKKVIIRNDRIELCERVEVFPKNGEEHQLFM